MALRKYTYKLYPKQKQSEALLEQLRLHQQLYNAALQERIDAYRKCGKTITYNEQQASLTTIRSEMPEYKALPCTSKRMTLRRLDKAFKAFFRRIKNGESPGFPRFKSINRFSSFELLEPRFTHTDSGKHGRLFVAGVGHIKARGQCRINGKIKTSQIQYKHGHWWLSLAVEGDAVRRASASRACAIDWGVAHLLTIVEDDGRIEQIPNQRYYQSGKEKQERLQRSVSAKKRGSNGWKKACQKLSAFKRKQANQRKDAQHKLSNMIAGRYALIAMESLQIKNMSRSSRGTLEAPGKNVKQKSGLNREILDTAPASLISMIRYKAEEAGNEFVETPTKKLKPSQRCPKCLHTTKENRKSQADFTCVACDYRENADVVSGINSLSWALGLGQERVPEVYTSKPLLSVA
ncbi:transposase [Idiomarina sp.]|uniref:RNA-guided endonuclease InsQ/TnpB family protein n=1 Tax=Idiomarina sp. TaxID=1874361 RepID=UPI001D5CFBE4|nr:transposase [Idiomarina sp.]MCJ8317695.1 transposase [Idiomarina sp.]NQZ17255.1 transposase [Idiomarina sp.]